MRLQKRLSRRIGSKEYVKWVITIPPEIIENLGWKEGQELKVEINGLSIVVKRSE